MDIYFRTQQIIDKDNLILLSSSGEGKTREFMTFSHSERFFDYKGDYKHRLNRKKVDRNYKTYAEIFIAAYPTISIIERQYQNLWECIGVISSILMAIYTV